MINILFSYGLQLLVSIIFIYEKSNLYSFGKEDLNKKVIECFFTEI